VKQPRDIEQLLRWAYRDELAKRVTSSAEGLWDRLADWRFLGTGAVDLGTHGPQRYDLGMPHPDAVTIEKAVGQLPDAVIDWDREAPSVLGDLLALADPRKKNNAPAASAVRMARCSTTVGWRSRRGTQVRVELEPPRTVVLVRSLRTAALVTQHAHMGTRPDWMPELPRPRHVPAARGSGPAIVGECRGRNWYSTGSYCPLSYEPSPISIAEARADYLAWWRGLDALAQLLAYRLEKFLPLRPAAFEMPWSATGCMREMVVSRETSTPSLLTAGANR